MPTPRTTQAQPRDAVVARVHAAVAAALDAQAGLAHAGLVLAVSGGRDSMVLLDATLAVARAQVRLVATYDHGTGEAARHAVRHVRAAARAVGVPVRVGRRAATARGAGATEAAWRAARWAFLRRAARFASRDGGRVLIATGHTADDQVETVAMRVLRGAGARGLAGMLAPSTGVVRPLLGVSAEDVAAYAAARGLAWVEDPGNASSRHLRNRVRRDLLPALVHVRSTLRADLLRLASAAALWRRQVDEVAAALATRCAGDAAASTEDGWPLVALADLADYEAAELRVLWPALLARAGVRVDRRGTARLAAFTTRRAGYLAAGRAPVGSAPVAGGVRVVVERWRGGGSPDWVLVVRRGPAHPADDVPGGPLPLEAGDRWVVFGAWRFRLAPGDLGHVAARALAWPGEWRVWLTADRAYSVRGWQPGDRWCAGPEGPARRVKRFLADRHVPAAERAGWPVVVADAGHAADAPRGEIVWIPGVRRSDAAPARPGQPGLLLLLCERTRGDRSVRRRAGDAR